MFFRGSIVIRQVVFQEDDLLFIPRPDILDRFQRRLQVVLDTAAEGVPVRELARAWNWSLARHGLEKDSRLGYSVGIGYPPDWGERTISIRTEDETVLAENMTFHVICGMWMTGFGYEVSESVRITRSGAETFTSFPRSLIRK